MLGFFKLLSARGCVVLLPISLGRSYHGFCFYFFFRNYCAILAGRFGLLSCRIKSSSAKFLAIPFYCLPLQHLLHSCSPVQYHHPLMSMLHCWCHPPCFFNSCVFLEGYFPRVICLVCVFVLSPRWLYSLFPSVSLHSTFQFPLQVYLFSPVSSLFCLTTSVLFFMNLCLLCLLFFLVTLVYLQTLHLVNYIGILFPGLILDSYGPHILK